MFLALWVIGKLNDQWRGKYHTSIGMSDDIPAVTINGRSLPSDCIHPKGYRGNRGLDIGKPPRVCSQLSVNQCPQRYIGLPTPIIATPQ
jgi:hypothetical protein